MHLEPWGFEISDVETDVYMWQGTLDESHPISMGRTIASELRSCRPVFAEGAGSLGFILYADAIFADLWPERTPPSAALASDAVRRPEEVGAVSLEMLSEAARIDPSQ